MLFRDLKCFLFIFLWESVYFTVDESLHKGMLSSRSTCKSTKKIELRHFHEEKFFYVLFLLSSKYFRIEDLHKKKKKWLLYFWSSWNIPHRVSNVLKFNRKWTLLVKDNSTFYFITVEKTLLSKHFVQFGFNISYGHLNKQYAKH